MTPVEIAWWIVALLGVGTLVAVCWLKGRRGAAVAAVLGAILPPVAAVLALAPSGDPNAAPYVVLGLVGCGLLLLSLIGAIRRAEPGSWWARRLYHEDRPNTEVVHPSAPERER